MTEHILNERYALESKVGEGGMAVTYRARDLLLNRTVAVKVMREQYTSDPQFVERFRREAQAAARLTHENIASVYDTGRAGGAYYIVMEFVEGTDLKQRIRRDGPLPLLTALEIGRQVAAALDMAHRNGLVHRDIKPHNILLDRDGKVKVTDFGIAKGTADSEDTGVIMGSVHYLSPEQARGETTTPSSDIYSLGTVLFEMLTGRTVFEGESALSVAHKQIYDRPPYPRTLRPDLPLPVETVIMRCLEKDPRARYQTAAEVKAVLTQLLNQLAQEETIVIRTPTAPPLDATMIYRAPAGQLPVAPPPQPVQQLHPVAPPQREQHERGGSSGWLITILFLLLLGAVGTGIYFVNKGITPPPPPPSLTVRVPTDLAGKSFDAANSELSALQLVGVKEEKEDDATAGTVLSVVSPTPGSQAKAQSVVTLLVSKGRPLLTMPDIAHMSKEGAVRILKDANINNTVEFPEENSDNEPASNVIRTEPPAGSLLKAKDTLKLVISKGQLKPDRKDYDPSVSADDILKDLGAEEAYVQLEKVPENGDTVTLWSGTVRAGDTIPPQTFDIPAGERGNICEIGAKDENSRMKTYEKVPYKSSVAPAPKPTPPPKPAKPSAYPKTVTPPSTPN